MRARRIAALAVVPVLATVALAACGGSGGGSSDGKISIGIGEPKHIVPTNANDTPGGQVVEALFTNLVVFDKANKPVNAAAEDITTSDSKVWTIKLKSGWTFHDGTPVTAQDYIDTWNYGAYAPNAQENNSFFEGIEGYAALQGATPAAKELTGLKKVDDTTFTVTLDAPYAEYRAKLGYSTFVPMPKAAFADMNKYKEAPVGQGPFKMDGTWEHDKKITVSAYDGYKGEKPKVKGIEFRVYQQPTAEYADLQANNVDVMTTIPTESLGSAKKDLGDRFKNSPSSSFTFLALPLYNDKFKNPEVRRAISKAIDREEITKTIFKDSRSPAYAFVSPVVAGYRADSCGDGCKYDPAKAKELLTAAGGLPGGQLLITYNVDGGHKEWVDAICNQLIKNLGVGCVGAGEPKFADLRTKAKAKTDIGAFRLGWAMDYPSMENYLTPVYTTNGSSNYYGYANTTFDQTVAAGNREPTADAAIKKYQEAEDMLAKDLPVAPLFFGQNVYGYSTKVKNVEINPFTRVDLIKIETA
ncbi:peptide ABC transporter substrate-binding protein [Longispora albida]|uniref:peptide ABC transporter substrate-binding protein n=1 Tax=Longispora albida TaxID=203523 RepID=UPI000382B7DC|nr:ABC transporter substrate-binding protein [Longispora albida]